MYVFLCKKAEGEWCAKLFFFCYFLFFYVLQNFSRQNNYNTIQHNTERIGEGGEGASVHQNFSRFLLLWFLICNWKFITYLWSPSFSFLVSFLSSIPPPPLHSLLSDSIFSPSVILFLYSLTFFLSSLENLPPQLFPFYIPNFIFSMSVILYYIYSFYLYLEKPPTPNSILSLDPWLHLSLFVISSLIVLLYLYGKRE